MQQLNMVALLAGILTLSLVAASYFIPWWQLTVGQPNVLAQVNFSPLKLNFDVFGNIMTVPLIWALNMSCLLTLLAGGIIMMVYAFVPQKPYAGKLLGYGYKQPLVAVLLFVIEVVGLVVSVKAFTGFDFPLMGSGAVGLPAGLIPGGITLSVAISSTFLWPFFLAITVAVLCVAARLYHRKLVKQLADNLPPPPPPPIMANAPLNSQ